MLIRLGEQPEVEAPDDDLVMRALVRADHTGDLSVTHVRLQGAHRPLLTERSTRVYYVLEGSATFTVGDAEPFLAQAGDAVVVPRGKLYALEGDLTYLVLNGPAYVEGDDVYEEA
jgi:mannose-6-phosphate isomerase-like protein (cupin superfamily)